MLKYSIAGLLICIVLIYFFINRPVEQSPGILAPDEPVQEKTVEKKHFRKDDFTISTLATFSLKAKVLSKKRYFFGRESELAPYDFALGWGSMSNQRVADIIKVSQSSRRYRWRTSEFPISKKEIEQQSANMHLIPATSSALRFMKKAKIGQIIELSGYLVEVNADDGWRWRSSMTRNDTGDGACEVIWVEQFKIVQ